MFYFILDYFLREVRASVLEISQIKREDKVIDICCGTGDQAVLFSKKSDFVYGIDLDYKTIEAALKRKSNVFFGVAYAEKLPFPDNYFDVVSISLALHEKDEELRKLVINEIKRIVKEDGRVIIADYNYPMPFNFLSILIRIIEWLAGDYHHDSFKNYLSSKGLNNLKVKKQKLVFKKTIKIIKI
jgi:ubiquinone/menaquinone biosynthesis C-methylase UbiE